MGRTFHTYISGHFNTKIWKNSSKFAQQELFPHGTTSGMTVWFHYSSHKCTCSYSFILWNAGDPAGISSIAISSRNVLLVSPSLYFIMYWVIISEWVKSKQLYLISLNLNVHILWLYPIVDKWNQGHKSRFNLKLPNLISSFCWEKFLLVRFPLKTCQCYNWQTKVSLLQVWTILTFIPLALV